MAKEFYGFFDSTDGDVRQYDAAGLSQLLAAAVQSGVSSHFGGGLEVTADGGSMQTAVSPGGAVIEGYVYVLSDDGGAGKTFTHGAAATADRIDRIVARLDRNADKRCITLAVLEGVPAAEPVPPALTRTPQVWEISLAQVRVPASAVFILPENVTDERADESVCGFAVSAWNSRAALDGRYVADEPISDELVETIIA